MKKERILMSILLIRLMVILDFLKLEDLIEDLEKKLHRKVDLVKFDCLNPLIKEAILNDMILLYNENTLCR